MKVNTLTWGIPIEDIKKFYPMAYTGVYNGKPYVCFDHTSVYNFPGDCGALILDGAGSIYGAKTMRAILKYASLSGFNKIFATLVNYDYPWEQERLKLFKNYRWKLVHKGKSNRTPEKNDYVFVKIIHNPLHKGY